MIIQRYESTWKHLSNSLIKTYAELRNNPLHSDLKIVSKNQTYYGHKVIFYTRSKKWGREKTLAGVYVLNWTHWSDQTIQDILDFVYLDKVTFLEDGSYDDYRTINLMSASSSETHSLELFFLPSAILGPL